MERRWPAEEILPFIELIDDPTHTANDDGTYNLSETQARAILDLRLQRLTQLGVKEVTDELEELAVKIKDYLAILASRERILAIISDELAEVREKFAVPRRTEITEWSGDMEDEDLIEREDMVVTITQGGYIKRTPLVDFRAQKRGGKGLSGGALKEDDVVTSLFVANTHTPLLVFTTSGMVYKLKTWRLPLGLARLARQGHREHPADRGRHRHRRRHARGPGRGSLGRIADRLRHLGGRRAPQRALRFHQCHAQRQDRDETAGG
jgi:DNA gyrase subunit A